jgi:regulation of enolase protein 1 (concanavalin A-like superfamily)
VIRNLQLHSWAISQNGSRNYWFYERFLLRYQNFICLLTTFGVFCCGSLYAQIAHNSPYDFRQFAVSAGASGETTQFPVEVSADGGGSIDVMTGSSSVTVRLVLPNATEIDAANAASFGYQFSSYAIPSTGSGLPLGLGFSVGFHVRIEVPSSATPGLYKVKVQNNSSESLLVQVSYLSASQIQIESIVPKGRSLMNQPVAIACLVRQAQVPLAGANVVAEVFPILDVSSRAAFSNLRRVQQTSLADGRVEEEYLVDATASGAGLTNAYGVVTVVPASVEIVKSAFVLGTISSGSTASSGTRIIVRRALGAALTLTELGFRVEQAGNRIDVPLLDSGPDDEQSGDGVYSGKFLPPVEGEYELRFRASGTSPSGQAYSRTSTSTLTVEPIYALVNGVSTSLVDSNGDLKIDQMNIAFTVGVASPGAYTLLGSLLSPSGRSTLLSWEGSLNAGTQTIQMAVPAIELAQLGAGAYTFQAVRLIYNSVASRPIADSPEPLPATVAVVVANLDRGAFYFTGTYSITPITGTSGTFDSLQYQVEAFTPGGTCSVGANLLDSEDRSIDSISLERTELNAGLNNFSLLFSGIRISDSQKNGPYTIGRLRLVCEPETLSVEGEAVQTAAYLASQFTFVARGISLSLQPGNSVSVSAGKGAALQITAQLLGAFDGSTEFTTSALPPGVSLSFERPQISGPDFTPFTISTLRTTAPGVYPITIFANGENLSSSIVITLTVTPAENFTIGLSASSISIAPGSVRTIAVTLTPVNGYSDITFWDSVGLPGGIVASFSPAQFAGAGSTTLTLTVAANTVPGTYAFSVRGAAQNGLYSNLASATVVVDANALPSPWISNLIGGVSGTATQTLGTFSSSATGGNIGAGTSDALHFVSRSMTGNGSLLMRVSPGAGNSATSKAGIMFRDGSGATDRFAFVGFAGTTGISFIWRDAVSGNASTNAGPGLNRPYWVRLTRNGNAIQAESSSDGLYWNPVGSPVAINLPSSYQAGLAVSGDAGSASANFDRLLFGASADFYWGEPQPQSRLASTALPAASYALPLSFVNGFNSNVSFSVSGLPAGATGSFNPIAISGTGYSVFSVGVGTAAAGTYPLTVTATSGSDQRSIPLSLVVGTVPPTALPDPWATNAIGLGNPGSSTFENSSYAVASQAMGLGATNDSMQFTSRSIQGDFTVIARVASIQNARPQSVLGLMVRQSLAPDSPYVSLSLRPTAVPDLSLQSRLLPATNAATEGSVNPGATPWLRLSRVGGVVTAAMSADGLNWTTVGSPKSIVLGSTILIGLLSASGETGQTQTGVFDNVSVVGANADFQLNATPVSRTIPSTGSSISVHSIRVNPFNGFNASVALSLTGLPPGLTASLDRSSVTPGGSANLRLSSVSGVAPGTYSVRIQGDSGALSRSVTISIQSSAGATVYPAPWSADDVGTPISAGSIVLNGNTQTFQASGSTFADAAQAFRFSHQQVTGDFEVRARMSTWTRFDGGYYGIMARETLNPDSAYVCLCVRADVFALGAVNRDLPGLSYRSLTGGATVRSEGPEGFSKWLRLLRKGNVFSAWYSNDSYSWLPLGNQPNVTLPSSLLLGLAVSSGSRTTLQPAELVDLSISGDALATPSISSYTTPFQFSISTAASTSWVAVPTESLNGLSGNISISASGLPAGVTTSSLNDTAQGQGVLALRSNGSAVAGSYPIQIVATQGSLVRSMPATLNISSASPAILPTDWSSIDYGSFYIESQPSFLNGTYQIGAIGCCWDQASDIGRFIYTPMTGNGTLVARLPSPRNGAPIQSGIALRANHSLTSPFVLVGANISNGLYAMSRSSEGATVTVGGGSVPLESDPLWLRIVRQASSFSVDRSADGISWTQMVAPIVVNLPTNLFAGLVGSQPTTFDEVVVASSPSFYLVPSPRERQISSGASSTHSIQVVSMNGFSGAVSFSLVNPPAGITGSFSSTSAAAGSSVTLTLTAAGTASGSYDVNYSGTDGSTTRTGRIRLNVTPFSISVTPLSQDFGGRKFYTNETTFSVTVTAAPGFNGTITLGAAGAPESANSPNYFTPPTLTGSGTSIYTVRVPFSNPGAPSAFNGSYPITFRATSGATIATTPALLTLKPMLLLSPPSALSGSVGDNLLATTPVIFLGGYNSPVTLEATGAPPGVSLQYFDNPAVYDPSGANFESSNPRVFFDVSSAAVPGVYPIAYRLTAPGYDTTFNSTLTIKGFSLAATPAIRNVAPGLSGQFTVNLSMVGGYNSAVAFSVLGLPAGATASFSPTSRTSSGSTTLTITTTAAIVPNSYPLTIVGTGPNSNVKQAPTVTLVVARDFSVSSPATAALNAGSSANATITVAALGGFTDSVALSASGLPSGMTASFATNPIAGSGTSVMTLSSSVATPAGVYPIVVTGVSGSLTRTATINVTIRSFTLVNSSTTVSIEAGAVSTQTVTLTMQQGFNSTVTFSTVGLPSGVTLVYSPTTRNSTGTSSAAISVSPSAVPGTYPVTLRGTSGTLSKDFVLNLTVLAGFTLANGGARTISAGGSANNLITLTASTGFGGSTGLTASGLPAGVTAVFTPTSVSGSGTSTLALSVATSTAAGAYPITVTGTNGTQVRTTSFTLTVRSFALSVAPASLSVTRGGATVNSTLTLTMQSGFNSSVAFSSVGAPAGLTVTFSPTSRTSTGTSSLTVGATTAVAAGTYNLTIRGTSGSLVKTASLSVTVN